MLSAAALDTARRLVALTFPPEQIAPRVRAVYDAVLRRSPRITTGNFTQAADADLHLLFELYDEHFFGGDVWRLVQASAAPLSFDFSARLTRSGGLTKRFAARTPRGAAPAPPSRFEISLSSTLLLQTFRDVHRTVRVNGLVCTDRLEATQRIFEHELIHLLEMLVWVRSSCDQDRFKTLAWNYFGHTQTKHDLVTQLERARARFDLHIGDRVAFTFDGRRHVGTVNRITRRATILVEHGDGAPYNDGKRYLKFYIPLPLLEKVG